MKRIYQSKNWINTICFAIALSSCSAIGAVWPPSLDPDPEVPPPNWDWQLAVPVEVNPDSSIEIYDIEMFPNETSGAVEMLQQKGYKVICYVDVGSWENWRDDKAVFPSSILGAQYYGFPDERWLDIRDVNPQKSQTGEALAAILLARFDRALNMGCDAVEPDNMDGYDTTAHESSGFPLTYEDQIYFNLWVANAVHERGMLIGLKNDINQAHDPRIYEVFDFVVSEQCFQYDECHFFTDFLDLNKPVFETEYTLGLSKFCPDAKASRISAIKKREDLDTWRQDCSTFYDVPPPVNQDPTAAFTAVCANLACDFTDDSSDGDGSVIGWSWDFGDNSSGTAQNPSHTYAAAGTYTARLIVTDDDGATDSVTQAVTVSAPPVGNQNPTAAFNPNCTDLACTFTDQSTDSDGTISTWSWDFGDGNGSSVQSPSHSYAAAGTYSVSLTVTDDGGATDTATQQVALGAVTSSTYYPEAISVSVGSYDWGSLASFTNQDNDTYDIASAQASEGSVDGSATDWEALASISGSVDGVSRLSLRYAGQYSRQSVSQAIFLYNYEANAWELFDTRTIGEGDDVAVLVEIATNPQRYVSSSGEIRARIRGFRAATEDFFAWVNYLAWEVEATGG